MVSALCVSAVLLCTVVAVVSARVLTTTSTDDQPLLSARHYQHTNRALGTKLVCDKCPAGTYVSVHCSPTAVRECSPCPKGTFTRGENGVQQCHHCQAPCPVGLIEKKPCMATQDRVCTCPPNSFLSRNGVVQCVPHSLCPPGTRLKKHGSETEDTLCKPCTKGTFSDIESIAMRCQNHTNCQALGMVLLTPGTRETDNLCGIRITTLPSLSSPLDSKQATFVQETMNTSIPPQLTENKENVAPTSASSPAGFNRAQTFVLIDQMRTHLEKDSDGRPKTLKELNMRLKIVKATKRKPLEMGYQKVVHAIFGELSPKVVRKWNTLVDAYKTVRQ